MKRVYVDLDDAYMSNFKKISEELESLLEDSVEVIDSTIEDEINAAQPEQKSFETSKEVYELKTGDYDYTNHIKVVVEEKSEKVDYNNPDKEVEVTETWYADEKPMLKAIYDTELDGPVHPIRVEILDAESIHNTLITLGAGTKLFNNIQGE